MTLPEKFAARVLSELGPEEGAALCAALDTEPPVSVRLNPAKCAGAAEPGAVQDGTGAAPGGYGSPQGSSGTDVPAPLPVLQNADGRVPWCADGYYLAVRPQFTFDSDFHAGAYYVQEASSQFVGRLMGGEGVAGKRILDLCAAPGGKTTLYASLAGPDGLVVANEIDRRRAQVLADNVRKWGTGNVAVTTCEPRQLGDFEAWFDMVAVDAPCSGEGMFRKDAQARAEWSEGNVKLCAARQDGILREAWRALKPGGRLIYSTCTFNRDEDEGALERMLAWAGDEVAEAEDMAVDGAWGIVCGRVGAFRTYRFYPYRARGEGFFAAVACKAYDAGGRCRTPKARRTVFAQVDKASAAECAPLGAHAGADVLRGGGRYLLRILRRAGRGREGARRSAARDLCGRGDGAVLQGKPSARSGAGVLLRVEPRGGVRGGAGRGAGAVLPAQAGGRRRGVCRRGEPGVCPRAGARVCEADR